jgi:hypothetical protein
MGEAFYASSAMSFTRVSHDISVVAGRPGTGIIGSHQETRIRRQTSVAAHCAAHTHDTMPLASKRPAGLEKISPTWRHPSPPPIQFHRSPAVCAQFARALLLLQRMTCAGLHGVLRCRATPPRRSQKLMTD